MARVLRIPHDWEPRPHQLEALQHFDSGINREFLVWHRRAGKDSYAINKTAKCAVSRVGSYYHMLPTSKQARKVVWLGIDKQGRRIIDQAFPPEIRKRTLDDEMLIELKPSPGQSTGSIWQCVGSDNYNSLVGTNVLGMTFSEWSLSNPRAYNYMRPILVENNGWATFIGTPRGRNFFFDQYNLVKKHPKWFHSLKTVVDTGLVTLEQIEDERLAGMPEDSIQQEFFCSFDAQSVGAIYDKWMSKLEEQGRIGSCPYDQRFPVETAWDIGHRDATAIWFIQRIGRDVHAIDYEEERGKDLRHFIRVIQQKPYVYSRHVFPHDMNKFEYGAGATIAEQARQLGIECTIAPKLLDAEGIEHVRVLLPRMRFDAPKCRQGVQALRSFHYEEADEADGFKISLKSTPEHDWSSHGSKALQYLAVTPEGWGLTPTWLTHQQSGGLLIPAAGQEWWRTMQGQAAVPNMLGHNGGPPLQGVFTTPADYDPLAPWRGNQG